MSCDNLFDCSILVVYIALTPRESAKPIPGRICEESIRRRGRSILGLERKAYRWEVAADDSWIMHIFGWRHRSMILDLALAHLKIPVKPDICQKNWQAGTRILISHHTWHHDTTEIPRTSCERAQGWHLSFLYIPIRLDEVETLVASRSVFSI